MTPRAKMPRRTVAQKLRNLFFAPVESAVEEDATGNCKGSCRKRMLFDLCGFLLAAVAAGVALYYIWGPAEGYLHSDCTDTLWWAQASYDGGSLFYEGFHYAALLPFSTVLIMLGLIPLTGVTMLTHNLGMTVFALLFVGALLWLGRSMRYSWCKSGMLAFTVTFLVSASDKLREIMWGHTIYYSLGILFFCFGLGLVMRILQRADEGVETRGKRWRLALMTVGLFVFTAATALNGLQSAVTYILPVCGALVLERFLASREEKHTFAGNAVRSGTLAVILAVGCLFGMVILSVAKGDIVAGYADAYSTFSAIGDWVEHLLDFFENWFTLGGVTVAKGDPIADLSAILQILRIGGLLLLLVLPLVPLFYWQRIRRRETRLVLLAHYLVSAFILFAVVFGSLGQANWRLTPMLGTAAVATFVAVADMLEGAFDDRKCRKWEKPAVRFGALFMALYLGLATVTAVEIRTMPADYGRDNALHQLTAELEERELKYGYATFWYSQAITLLSDNEVQVRNVNVTDDGVTKYTYQSQYAWYEDKEDAEEYFLLLSSYEYSILRSWLAQSEVLTEEIVIPAGNATFYICIFSENIF